MEDKNEEMRAGLEMMLDNMGMMKQVTELNACLAKVAYDTLVGAGFTEEQAFELIARKGAMLS
ncbi:MAG: hypothetical protein LC650_02975 [Actinobacteria bacterium]|nr:hypothetical protein [Actinomycetota bacterium]